MGYVIQGSGLFPYLTAQGNITLMARHLKRSTTDMADRVDTLYCLTHFPEDALVAISLSAAILVAVPLGIAAARQRKLGQIILGIGTYPAIAALFLYSLLPIVRNTHTRLTSIPADLIDSATALGLPMAARLKRIDLALAVPAVLAGIKDCRRHQCRDRDIGGADRGRWLWTANPDRYPGSTMSV